MSRLRIKKRR